MSEVCTYGGDTGFIPGYSEVPEGAGVNNALELTRTQLVSADSVQWTVLIELFELGVNSGAISTWRTSISGLEILRDRHLIIEVPGLTGVKSAGAIPGLEAGSPVWLRGRRVASTGAREYWYAHDPVLDEDEVSWVPLDADSPGPTGTVDVSTSDVVLTSDQVAGRLYYASEEIDGVRVWVLANSDIPDNSATSFPLSVGGTVDVLRGAEEPRLFLSPASFGATYGTGHYGLCDQENRPGCGRARAGSNPVTTTERFGECEPVRCPA